MTAPMPRHQILDSRLLIPREWLAQQAAEAFYVFNPTITVYQGRLLMVYRVDFGREQHPQHRVACALCELNQQGKIIPDSVVALSDTITAGGSNHYDPRFVQLGERLFVHYNNNWDTVPNAIFMVELDPTTLSAMHPARPLILEGPRQAIEKNWMLFEHERELLAVYQIAPHCILRLNLDDPGSISCEEIHHCDWSVADYELHYGAPRGGTPPLRIGDNYVSIFHSRTQSQLQLPSSLAAPSRQLGQLVWLRSIKRWIRERMAPIRYFGGVYVFSASPPFSPVYLHPKPLLDPRREGRRRRPTASHLGPRSVVFPCGLVKWGEHWLLSYGAHDERCVLLCIADAEMLRFFQSEEAQ